MLYDIVFLIVGVILAWIFVVGPIIEYGKGLKDFDKHGG